MAHFDQNSTHLGRHIEVAAATLRAIRVCTVSSSNCSSDRLRDRGLMSILQQSKQTQPCTAPAMRTKLYWCFIAESHAPRFQRPRHPSKSRYKPHEKASHTEFNRTKLGRHLDFAGASIPCDGDLPDALRNLRHLGCIDHFRRKVNRKIKRTKIRMGHK